MILNTLLDEGLSTKIEGEHRKNLKLKRYDLIPAVSLAAHMARKGLDVIVRHENAFRFWDLMQDMGEDMFAQQQMAYDRARRARVNFSAVRISEDILRSDLAAGRLIVYGVKLTGGIKHAILIYDSNAEQFFAIDPLTGPVIFSAKRLLDAGDLDTGRWNISVAMRNSHENIEKHEKHGG